LKRSVAEIPRNVKSLSFFSVTL